MTNYYGKPSAPPRLVGRLLPRHISMDMLSGVYIDGDFQGEAQGWYNANLPGLVPVGLWDASGNRSDANEWYDNNVPAPVPVGLWDGLGGRTDANGYYVDNSPALIPDGMYRDGGLVDPYYERIRDAALAQGGGLYLFQLEHGQYAGEQVIWQEMGEMNPWTPGQGLPQGKTYDLMGSGEYLGQSVSMRRPVDGVFETSALVASSDDVGGHLHQDKPSAWFAGVERLSGTAHDIVMSTTTQNGANGVLIGSFQDGATWYRRSASSNKGNLFAYGIGFGPGHGQQVVGGVYGARENIYLDDLEVADAATPASYPDTTAENLLTIGARASTQTSQNIHARYTYIAIYTREPTAHEISLHKRTP